KASGPAPPRPTHRNGERGAEPLCERPVAPIGGTASFAKVLTESTGRFLLYLHPSAKPLERGFHIHVDRKAALSMRGYGERTAVVLDEQPLWLDAMEQLLGGVGITLVGKTTDPGEALDLVEEHHPDVLLADFNVGDGEFDGLECLRRAHDIEPGLKMVVLSAT